MLQRDVVCIYEQFMYDCVNQKDMMICSVAFKKVSLFIISLTSKTLRYRTVLQNLERQELLEIPL